LCGMVGEKMSNLNLITLLEKAMNGSALQHSVLANNIANVNTPGYKRGEVNFRSCFDEALDNRLGLETTSPLHLNRLNQKNSREIVIDTQTTLRNDGNNVDIDVELATMAENNIYFNSLAQLLSSQLSMLRQAIAEGRR
jgi:flagellar basal-body rod protein FlgB